MFRSTRSAPLPGGLASVGFPKVHFTEEHQSNATCPVNLGARQGEIILDFTADDIDSECVRIDGLGVTWVVLPSTQPWGRRSMLLRDPQGQVVNVSHAASFSHR